MADPIQASISFPIPDHQTQTGYQDSLSVTSPRQIAKSESNIQSARTAANDSASEKSSKGSAFENYLNQKAILAETYVTKEKQFDTAAEIRRNSTYQHPGDTKPL